MTRQQALDEIGKALGVLAHQVEQEKLSGMFSKILRRIARNAHWLKHRNAAMPEGVKPAFGELPLLSPHS